MASACPVAHRMLERDTEMFQILSSNEFKVQGYVRHFIHNNLSGNTIVSCAFNFTRIRIIHVIQCPGSNIQGNV